MTETLAVAPWRQFTVEVSPVTPAQPVVRSRHLHRRRPRPGSPTTATTSGSSSSSRCPGTGSPTCPTGADWYERWRALPEDAAQPVPHLHGPGGPSAPREVDVDLVLHGDGGPASRWAVRTRRSATRSCCSGPTPGSPATTAASSSGRRPTGHRAAGRRRDRRPGDLPSILERLPAHTRGEALLEVPARPTTGSRSPRRRVSASRGSPRDGAALRQPAGPRGGRGRRSAPAGPPASRTPTSPDVDVDDDDPVGGSGRGAGPAAVRVARRRGGRHPHAAPAPRRRARAWTARRSRSWATGGWAAPTRSSSVLPGIARSCGAGRASRYPCR